MQQFTIKTPQDYQGWGIIFKRQVTIRISPAPVDTGIIFNPNISANINNAFISNHFVGLKKNKHKLYFVEHFLSACFGLGVDNLYVNVLGDELPFGDGSASVYVKLIQSAGITSQNKPKKYLLVKNPVSIADKDGLFFIFPSQKLSITLLGNSSITKEKLPDEKITSIVWCQNKKNDYQNSIAPARTFGNYPDIDFLKKILPFEIITKSIPNNKKNLKRSDIVLPKRFRYTDEMLRHKMLDLIGDLALLGKVIKGKIIAFNPSHKLNHKLLKKLTNMK
ncbi:MAG: UDP-3-O-acyl-N-acetylglucosamine deacetylase [candidate division WOR-3 bacterium]|nr:UDP-3-O-acyl-N-acetylglucosamine deacetylase [candidate division WOR-3 bacterium]